ncbi:transposase [Paracoccus zhejiangensis]|uniref:Transposase n=1 Tax=Paracoccus zhejiangensis TaxID=1077935 RepID=A0A2H5EXE7_9RHOB|nr:transposase [Paracoccus zhejiangensis]AUH63954.1 transposase [Paracoccus zhejiangensis]
MSRYLRPRLPGVPIFFTVTLAQRDSWLLVEEIDRLRMAVAATRSTRPFAIEAWVVLPDHLHCIWRLPDGDTDYSARWGAIKARCTRAVTAEVGWNPTLRSASKVAKGDAGLWQRRFWEHHLRDEADLAAHLRYCWWNPVKHRLVERPEDWPYSSFHRDKAGGRMDWVSRFDRDART